MARGLQEEKTTSSRGAWASEAMTATSGCCKGESTIRAETSASCTKAKLTPSAFVGSFKEQDEGDAQEVSAVCRDCLPWQNNEGMEETTEAKPQLVPAKAAN